MSALFGQSLLLTTLLGLLFSLELLTLLFHLLAFGLHLLALLLHLLTLGLELLALLFEFLLLLGTLLLLLLNALAVLLVAATLVLVTWTESIFVEFELRERLARLLHVEVLHPCGTCGRHEEMILARVVVELLQVIHRDGHGAQGSILAIPRSIVDAIDALQVVTHTERTNCDGCVIGHQKNLFARCEEFDDAADDGWIGKRPVMRLAGHALDTQAIFALLAENQSLGQSRRYVATQERVGPIGLLIVGRLLLAGETVDFLVGLGHNHESAATLFHHLGDEFQLTLEHQARVYLGVAVA